MWMTALMLLSLMGTEIPQKVQFMRFSDRVVIRDGVTGAEEVLFYNKKFALLGEGDAVQQGSSAITECLFEDASRMRFFTRARYRFGELSKERHVVIIDDFTRILILSKDNVTLILPGGTTLSTGNSECYLEMEGHLIHIRNAGFFEVNLSGHLVAPENEVLPAGHTLSVPLFDPRLGEEPPPVVVREVEGMIVKTTGDYQFEELPGAVVVQRPGPGPGSAVVGGARIRLETGDRLKLRFK